MSYISSIRVSLANTAPDERLTILAVGEKDTDNQFRTAPDWRKWPFSHQVLKLLLPHSNIPYNLLMALYEQNES